MGQACNVCRSRRGKGLTDQGDEFTSHLEGRTKFEKQLKLDSFEEFYDSNLHPCFFELAEKNRYGLLELKLVERVQQSREVFLYTFQFMYGTDNLEEFDDVPPIHEWIFGAKPGQPLSLALKIDGRIAKRQYCPISLLNDQGSVTFAIKIFKEQRTEKQSQEASTTDDKVEEETDAQNVKIADNDEQPEYIGLFTEHLHRHVDVGGLVMVEPVKEENGLHPTGYGQGEVPSYRGDGMFEYKRKNVRIEKLCLVCHDNDTDVIPLFSMAQAVLLSDAVGHVKTVMLLLAVDSDQVEDTPANWVENQ